jgi:RNA polymerase sigma factor (sigma-70 family)
MTETTSEFYLLHGMLLAAVGTAVGEAVSTWLQEESMSEPPDTKALKERKASFEAIISDHQRIIYKVCRTYCNTPADKQDLYQEIVYELWKAYPDFKGHSKISTWLYIVALRTGEHPYRKEKIKLELMDSLPDRPSDEAMNGDTDDRISRLFHQLEGTDRAVLTLMMEGYNQTEIAPMLELSREAVHKRVKRLRTTISKR